MGVLPHSNGKSYSENHDKLVGGLEQPSWPEPPRGTVGLANLGLVCSFWFAMARTFPMDWSELDQGSNLSLVCKTLLFDVEHERHVMVAFPSKKKFHLTGLLEAGFESYTLFDAKLVTQFPVPLVALSSASSVLGHKEVTWDSLMSVIDMCCGFGGFSQGILPCGFHTSVAVDHNDKMLRLISNVSNVPLVLGDVGDKATICMTWKESQGSRTMTGGFSCQPFSSLGDGKSSADSRSSCLTKLLHAAFFLRVHIVVLECVAPAAQDSFVKAEIEYFCNVTGFFCTQRSMKLDQIWPCRRHRSFWVLSSPLVGEILVPELFCPHVVPSVENLIPFISPWDQNDEDALKLSEYERNVFGGNDGDFSNFLLNAKGVSPCALHAWGNQLTECPCGCRPCGLSAHRLAEKGLFGLLVQSAVDGNGVSHIRHVHPSEAMALNGMDPTLDFGLNPRLTLSAVGQLASPLQVVWIMAAVLHQIVQLRFGKVDFSAETQLQAYMSWIIMKCGQVWPPTSDSPQVDKFASLLKCWEPVEHLSLEELMFPQRWVNRIEGQVTIAAILDVLFRDAQQKPSLPLSCDLDEDTPMEDAETPWLDSPCITDDPTAFAGIDAAFCTVIFDEESQAPVKINPLVGSTLQELISAHVKLVGPCSIQRCVDGNGQSLPLNHCLAVGELIHVTLQSVPEQMPGVPAHVKEPAPTKLDADVSLTAEWSQPVAECVGKPSVFDIGECSVSQIHNQAEWLNADPLLGLKGDQFLMLSTPQIANPHQLWSVRNQFLQVKDRMNILENQGAICSDDELRFHLFALSQKYIEVQVKFSNDPVKQMVTIDPLIASAWLQGKAFLCENWGKDHGFVHAQSLPLATVFKLGSHWVPVAMHPVGDTLNAFVWDADGGDHLQLNEIIERLGLPMGFVTVCIQRDRRMFFTSELCGTLAIAYLHSMFLQAQLPANHTETSQRFLLYREEFVKSLSSCDITRRPWVWASGDPASSSGPTPAPNDSIQLPDAAA